jgi:hypothetical protein
MKLFNPILCMVLTMFAVSTVSAQEASVASDADLQNSGSSESTLPAATITGSGTANSVPLWTTSSNLGNSSITQVNNVVNVADPLTISGAASGSTPLLSVKGTGTGAGSVTIDGFGNLTIMPGSGAKVLNLLPGVGAVSSTGSWAGYSALNLIPGSALYAISSAQTVLRIGFTGGSQADVSNMVLYTTGRGSTKITAVTPVKLKGSSAPAIKLTSAATCPNQPVSTSNPCIVRLDPVAVSLSPLSDYYLVIYYKSGDTNNASLDVASGASASSLSGTYQAADDTRLTVGQSIPTAVTSVPYGLMAVTTN